MRLTSGVMVACLLMAAGVIGAQTVAKTEAELRAAAPWILADSSVTSKADGTWTILDNVKRPFVSDADVLGVWKVVDLVESPDQFNPYAVSFTGNLLWKQVEFFPGGFQKGTFGTFVNAGNRWTKGFYLNTNPNEATASRYEIQKVAETTYLFVEWKSGDYTMRASKPWYYVFKR